MCRCLLIAFICLPLFGCTVGWYELREATSTGTSIPWKCPQTIEINVISGHATRTSGFKEANEERCSALTTMAREVAYSVYQDHGCNMSMGQQHISNDVLKIKVDERQQLSALPQEYLTGLSFGLIPSWGTRPAEFIIEFAQNERSATFAIDEVRINHITMTPFTVLTFALESERQKFRKALELFISAPNKSQERTE